MSQHFSFRHFSIRRKILLLFAATSALLLVAASITLVISEFYSQRNSLTKSSAVLVEIIAIDSAAPVAFKDENATSKILSALSANPKVISAQIYTPDMELFSEFKHPEKTRIETATVPFMFSHAAIVFQSMKAGFPIPKFKNGALNAVAPISINNRTLGVLFIKFDLQDLRESLLQSILIATVFLLITFLLSYVLSNYLQAISLNRSIRGITPR